MPNIDKQIARLKSPKPVVRYDACEEMRVAPSLSPQARDALLAATKDPSPEVADAATRALETHSPSTPPLFPPPPNALPVTRTQIASAALAFFSGLTTAVLAAGHLVGVVTTTLDRSPFQYTFRVYSLLLLGGVLVVLGSLLAAASIGVARGERLAWRQAVWAAVALLAVNVTLAPINGFGGFLSIIATINLVALLVSQARLFKAEWDHESPRLPHGR